MPEYDAKRNPLGAYLFRVKICGTKIGFKRVTGLRMEVVSDITEIAKKGGEEIVRTKGKKESKKQSTFVLEKGLMPADNSEQRFILEKMKPGTSIEEIEIIVLNADRKEIFKFTFRDCAVISYSVNDFDSTRTDYLTQSMEIQFKNVKLSSAN